MSGIGFFVALGVIEEAPVMETARVKGQSKQVVKARMSIPRFKADGTITNNFLDLISWEPDNQREGYESAATTLSQLSAGNTVMIEFGDLDTGSPYESKGPNGTKVPRAVLKATRIANVLPVSSEPLQGEGYLQGTITARLGNPPELRYTPNDQTPVTTVNLPLYGRSNNVNGRRVADPNNPATWVKVSVWGDSAINTEKFCDQGTWVSVAVSNIVANAFSTNNGKLGTSIEGKARWIRFLGPYKDGANGDPVGVGEGAEELAADIPF